MLETDMRVSLGLDVYLDYAEVNPPFPRARRVSQTCAL
jgi:hypothetical protein